MKTARRTIGRLAGEAGVSVETIRYYERRGLLRQPRRESGGREYGDEALWVVRYVKAAQSWGLSLKAIESLLSSAEQSPNFCASVRATAAAKIAEIDESAQRTAPRTQRLYRGLQQEARRRALPHLSQTQRRVAELACPTEAARATSARSE